jgi:hypothetical protein
MDKLNHYRSLLKSVIGEWAEASRGDSDIETLVVFDDDHGQYMLVSTGWTPKSREHSIIFHARLREGKVWIEWDGTYPSMTEELIRRGLLQQDIVFNWHDPDVRAIAAAQGASV